MSGIRQAKRHRGQKDAFLGRIGKPRRKSLPNRLSRVLRFESLEERRVLNGALGLREFLTDVQDPKLLNTAEGESSAANPLRLTDYLIVNSIECVKTAVLFSDPSINGLPLELPRGIRLSSYN